MVINKFGDRLYNGLVQTQTEHLRAVAAKIESAQGESFLRELKLRWDHHNKSMQMIRDILMVRPAYNSLALETCWLTGVPIGSSGCLTTAWQSLESACHLHIPTNIWNPSAVR